MSSSSSDPSVSPSERAGDADGSRASAEPGREGRSSDGNDSSSLSLDEHALLESIFNTSAAAITVLDTDGRIVQANTRAEEVLGLSPSAIEGRSYDDPLWEHETLDGDPFPEEKQPFVQVMRSGEPVYDVQHAITWPDGRRRILSIDGAPLRDNDGTIGGAVFIVDDITERKRREWALREERDRFETLLQNLPTPVVHGVLDEQTFIISTVNAAFEEVFGIPAETAQGQSLNDLIVPEDRRDEAVELDQKAVEEGISQAEVRRSTADGLRDFQVQVTVRQREESGVELYTIYTDITERKEMEKTLRNREKRLRSITQNISDGIYRSDPEEGIVYANDAFVEMFGYDSLTEIQEVASTALYDSPEERARLVRIEQEEGALDGEEVTFRRKDGTTFIGLLSSRAVRDADGTVMCYDGVITDITERKAYEEEMAYRSELEHTIVDISTQFISAPIDDLDAAIEEALGAVGSFVDADRSYVFLVDAEAQTTSNTHEWCDEGIRSHQPELQNIPFTAMPWFMDKMHRNEPLVLPSVTDLPEAASALQDILEDGNIQSLVVLPMTRGGTLVGFIGFDAVREQRDWDPDTVTILRVLGDAIASALHRKTMEENLRAAKEEAEEASVLKSAMLANMSHEIRTPLTSIVGLSEVLQENLDGDQANLAEIVYKSSQRLKETLTSVLQLSKLEAGAHDLERGPVDLSQVADETVKLLHPKAVDQSVDIEATVPADTAVTGEWDEGALTRIVTNLAENAIKFTPAGGTVAVRVHENGEEAVLEVEDSGVGIDEGFLPDIFNAFEQEDSGIDREHEGSGLGLAITKRLTEALGGDIDVESEKGVGTCFTVRLPRRHDGTPDEE
jgi:PAS domain S-box-containing protein